MYNLYKRVRAIGAMFKYWGYDIPRYFKYLNYVNNNNSEEKLKGILTKNYHAIEKGLTMPSPRLGFGESHIDELTSVLNKYQIKGYNLSEYEFIYSINVLNEYLKFHKRNNYPISEKIINEIHELDYKTKISDSSSQLTFTNASFFSMVNSSFDQFATSRHSVRNYISKEIPDETIIDCVKIAQRSPSSCNRQPIRVYVTKNKNLIEKTLKLQSGNRGFGHLSSIVFIITSDLSLFQDFLERNEPALNAGMFSMSLLYALHQQRIGGCSLNWCATPQNDKALHNIMSIPDNEMIHLIISGGYPPETFKVAASPRKNTENILKIVK
jgi:nitroreductase